MSNSSTPPPVSRVLPDITHQHIRQNIPLHYTTYKLYNDYVPLSGKQLVKLLRKNGWQLIRINGSHHIMGKGTRTVVVPVHGSEALGKGLEQKILKQAGVKK